MKPQKIALIGSPSGFQQSMQKLFHGTHHIECFTEKLDDTDSAFALAVIYQDGKEANQSEKICQILMGAPGVPKIVASETTSPHEVAQAFRMGAKDFIFLPSDDDAIYDSILRNLANAKNQHKKVWWKRLLPFFGKEVHAKMHVVPQVFTEVEAPNLQFQLFGNLKIFIDGAEVNALPRRMAKSILAYLIYKYPKPVHREVLMDKFWPNKPPESARNCLNVTMCSIRRSLQAVKGGGDIIVYKDESYGINPDLKVERDLDYFEAYWKKGQQIEIGKGTAQAMHTYHQAFAFYRNDFLEDLIYEEWTESVREHYREIWLYVLDRLGSHFFEKEKYRLCVNMCKKMLDKDGCLENIHRRLMSCYFAQDMKMKAVQQFKRCCDILKKELGTHPSKATYELMKKIQSA